MRRRAFFEFFAGAGMARLGLGPGWTCRFANDFDEKKCASYAANWGDDDLRAGDIADLTTGNLPGVPDLAWASFPCQDLSLAGAGAGLKGERSGSLWHFMRLVRGLRDEGRAPRIVVLENVVGALASRSGQDFSAIIAALAGAQYRVGALVVDAIHFLPQSRPRLFVIAVDHETPVPPGLRQPRPDPLWTTRSLDRAVHGLDPEVRAAWIWWRLPAPAPRREKLADLIESDPEGVAWHSPAQTLRLLAMMTERHAARVRAAQQSGAPVVGAIYRRTRPDALGVSRQRAEVRFDGVAGCLRTGSGGSSRQTIMTVCRDSIRSRLLSVREAARLMGLPASYRLPANYRDGYHLVGDGVVVPVVRHLAKYILEPVAAAARPARQAA